MAGQVVRLAGVGDLGVDEIVETAARPTGRAAPPWPPAPRRPLQRRRLHAPGRSAGWRPDRGCQRSYRSRPSGRR
ncbi:hypothetical protein G6F22_020847 [Rhizopus arrhizus]|nr:hypothetical protein G6F22_020847 [Rhizopus arrhizus]